MGCVDKLQREGCAMNILVLGNGFDLAHGLPTSYRDFLAFCKKVKTLYEYSESISQGEYKAREIDLWEMNESIKDRIVNAYADRKINKCIGKDGIEQNISIDSTFNELYGYIQQNTWLEYFWNTPTYVGENWIDFETEIAAVVKSLDVARSRLAYGDSILDLETKDSAIISTILKASKGSLQHAFGGLQEIDKFIVFLVEELDKLIRVLEIYINEFIGKIKIKKVSSDIVNVNADHILSFNYSDTYERLYAVKENIEYDYVHGKADVKNVIASNNMVLGIEEYPKGDEKNEDISFIAFKKFYQRIHKQSGCEYKRWIEKISEDEKKGKPWTMDNKDHSRDHRHNLYIFGHSLDISDRDILREFILHDNVDTTIFYYERIDENGVSDNGRTELGKKIANLVKVIGQEELIKRTGGSTKTIDFKLQQNM